MELFLNLLAVFLLGCIFGLSELLSRYPEPRYIFCVFLSYIYMLMNGAISVGAFLLIKYFKNEALADVTNLEINNLIIAGLGGMMILRSSLFSIEHKGEQVNIGFGTITQIFLDSVEKKMSTNAATLRMDKIDKLMSNISFEKSKEELTSLCVSYIDNFSKDDTTALNIEIQKIANLDISNQNKSLQLGRFISRYCDFDLLEKAIKVLGEKIQISADEGHAEDSIDTWIDKLKT